MGEMLGSPVAEACISPYSGMSSCGGPAVETPTGNVSTPAARGSLVETAAGSVKRYVLSWRYDLAKLNTKCHMNYSQLFVTEPDIFMTFSFSQYYGF